MNSIAPIFKSYFRFCLHPFRTHQEFVRGAGEKVPDLSELLAISWIFVIVQAIYDLVGLNMGKMLLEKLYQAQEDVLPSFLIPGGSEDAFNFSIYFTIFSVVFFPIVGMLYVKVWNVIIEFFVELFGKKDIRSEQIDLAANGLLVSNIFLVFPIIGELFKGLSRLVYLFAGLRENLGFSPTQAVVVLLAPLMIIMLAMFFFFIFGMMLLTSF